MRQIEAVRRRIEAGTDREGLQRLLPTGGARNAVDCAPWDLEAKSTGNSAWRMAGLDRPRPLLTTFTVGASGPQNMAADARAYTQAKAIKLKLTGQPEDRDRVRAVRAMRPDVWLGVDANQGFTREVFLQRALVLAGKLPEAVRGLTETQLLEKLVAKFVVTSDMRAIETYTGLVLPSTAGIQERGIGRPPLYRQKAAR